MQPFEVQTEVEFTKVNLMKASGFRKLAIHIRGFFSDPRFLVQYIHTVQFMGLGYLSNFVYFETYALELKKVIV